MRLEVPSACATTGGSRRRSTRTAVRAAARAAKRDGVQAVAVCFLYSYVDPTPRGAVRRIVAEEFPEAFVCLSHEVAPEFREYERLSTAVVNAYLGPVMAGYIERLRPRLAEAGVDGAAAHHPVATAA